VGEEHRHLLPLAFQHVTAVADAGGEVLRRQMSDRRRCGRRHRRRHRLERGPALAAKAGVGAVRMTAAAAAFHESRPAGIAEAVSFRILRLALTTQHLRAAPALTRAGLVGPRSTYALRPPRPIYA